METTERSHTPPVIEQLLGQARRYSLFQTVRLLELWHGDAKRVGGKGPAREEVVRFRSDAALVHPRTAITAVDRVRTDSEETPKYRITQVLLGLYGTLSPLPEVYSEEIIRRLTADGKSMSATDPVRDFLDLFNHRLVSLLHRAWAKARPEATFDRSGEDPITQILFCIMGIDPALRFDGPGLERLTTARYAAFFARKTRSADAVEWMLSDLLGGTPVRVQPFALRQVPIPEDQQCRLGMGAATLDSDCMIGSSAYDRAGKIRLWIGPMDRAQFVSLAPGGELRTTLGSLLGIYVRDSMDHDVVLEILGSEKPPLRLGERDARLGIDAWLYDDDPQDSGEPFAGFPGMSRGGERSLN